MAKMPIYQVDAFAGAVFGGNPAAVVLLEDWLDVSLLQAIASENNLSETAFLVPVDEGFELRWFTPAVEVNLCGHATLASAHVLFAHRGYSSDSICFHTHSGALHVTRSGDAYTLDFPAYALEETELDSRVAAALGATASQALLVAGVPKQVYVYEFEEDVAALDPDFPALLAATDRCVIATAPGNECDFVSRFFGPQVGVDEDPVTGSAHCALVPYWSARLGQAQLSARQISARGGSIQCEQRNGRVLMTGQCQTFMQGEIRF
ncbi:PhzF family phenazine biosynthesis protein [Pseudohalioglobus sediminis]|uniref:PhzF family phenazine biosynthesis protein n=1 Tax=Pseudohalioglobus sediminis TaxID=2606449 RepID=A0A5B0WPK3_9GAMM|nr:PhzF family phenazine biosynthesis protein [Pseudohalioglobus sediminis]KAA1188165.1 PhzF family phenazine biosynthesis protein [Pseudohalioglobus sediminis]